MWNECWGRFRARDARTLRSLNQEKYITMTESRSAARLLNRAIPPNNAAKNGCWSPQLTMTGYPRFPLLIVAFAALLAVVPAKAVDLDELTVVTLARDGSWGVAAAGSQGQAIAAAIRDCRAMAAAPSDCGAQIITTRADWVIANLCGSHKVMVTGKTRAGAEQAALLREMELKQLYVPDLPPCRRVLTVDPRGAVFPGQGAPTH